MTTTTNTGPTMAELVDRYLRCIDGISAAVGLDDETLDTMNEAGPYAIIELMRDTPIKSAEDARAVLRWLQFEELPIKAEDKVQSLMEEMAAVLGAGLGRWLDQAQDAGERLRRAFPEALPEAAESTRQYEPRLFELVDHASDLVTAVNGAFLAVKGLEDTTERAGLCWLLESVEQLAKGLHHQLASMDDAAAEHEMEEA